MNPNTPDAPSEPPADADASAAPAAAPVSDAARITSLDLVRGVAVLGILLMNAVSFKFGLAPYLNLSAGGSETWLDWAVGAFGEIFVDQKFMGLFSLLFGAGVILFIDRAEARGARAAILSLWRNLLLLLVGILHGLLWDGDVLTIYAVASVILLALRRLSPKPLIAVGVGCFALAVAGGIWAQTIANNPDTSLVGIWTPGEEPDDSPLLILVAGNYFLRALGMILIGAALYRIGFMGGGAPARTYRIVAIIGVGVGLPLAAAGVAATALNAYSPQIAFIGQIPNTLGTIPASIGYMSIIIIWNGGADNWIKRRLRAAGRMAFTNYLTQTIIGMLVLNALLAEYDVNRAALLAFAIAVWALQLWWSQAWLSRFRFGPAEWLWRVGTYRRMQPLRR